MSTWPSPSPGYTWEWENNEVQVSVETAVGVDSIGPWIDTSVISPLVGQDSNGMWIDDSLASSLAGVDVNGPWIIDENMARVYLQELTKKAQANGYAGLDNSGKVPENQLPLSAAGGNARVLLWDATTNNYLPSSYRTDTTAPREFVGPVDPSTIGSITGPAKYDRWTPTDES